VKGREGDWCPPHDLFARRPCPKGTTLRERASAGVVKGREGDWCPPHDLFARRPCRPVSTINHIVETKQHIDNNNNNNNMQISIPP